jgi:hypothetical protein
VRYLNRRQSATFLRALVASGKPIRKPTYDEMVEHMRPACLLNIARRRGYYLHLSRDRKRVVIGLDVPFWFGLAVIADELQVLDLMRHGVLRDFRTAPPAGGLDWGSVHFAQPTKRLRRARNVMAAAPPG